MGALRVFVISALAIVLSTIGTADVPGADSPPELTFTRVNGQRHSVWVANSDGSAARKVVADAYGGRLSADGRWLVYSRPQQSSNSGLVPLYVVSLRGGKTRRIGEVRGEQWSPDGAKLAIIEATGLAVVDPASGKRRQLARGHNLWQPNFSPDGRTVVYVRSNGRGGKEYRSDIFAVTLSDGAVTRLTRDGHSARPLWGRRGSSTNASVGKAASLRW